MLLPRISLGYRVFKFVQCSTNKPAIVHLRSTQTAAAVAHGPPVLPTQRSSTNSATTTRVGLGMLLSLDSPPDGDSNTTQQLPALSLEETLQAVAFPPTGVNLGPRVEHVQVAAAGLLSEAVGTALALPQSFVLELIRFGAVHYCPVMPQPSPKAAPRMSPAHLERMQQLRAAGIARHGKSPKLQVPQRIMGGDCEVHEGGYIRVHVHPKRFPAAYSLDWRQAVVADRPEYVVVDKPAGVQVPPTVDNMLESVVALTAGALGLAPESLCNTHRLDVGTSGIVVLAKNPGWAAWFSGLLSNKPGAVVKTYRCLSAAPPPLGRMVHWAVVKQRAAGEPPHTRVLLGVGAAAAGGEEEEEGPVEGAVRCELIVEQVQQVSLTGAAAAEWGPAAYESTLQLVTGRTHQIRAQMAAVQCPLLGDQLYTALADMWQQEQQQQLQEQMQPLQGGGQQQSQQQQVQPLQAGGQQPPQQQDDDGGSAQHRHAGAHWSKVYQTDPSRPIGLQAARLKVRNAGGRMTATTAPPLPLTPCVGEESAAAQPPSGGTEQVLMRRGSSKSKDKKNNKKQQRQKEEGSDVRVGESGMSHNAAPPPPGEPEWVEFEAGTPWWRA